MAVAFISTMDSDTTVTDSESTFDEDDKDFLPLPSHVVVPVEKVVLPVDNVLKITVNSGKGKGCKMTPEKKLWRVLLVVVAIVVVVQWIAIVSNYS